MNKQTLLTRARGISLFSAKFFPLAVIFLSTVVFSNAQTPADVLIYSRPTAPYAFGGTQEVIFSLYIRVEAFREATNVVVTAQLPNSIAFSRVQVSRGECQYENYTVTCTFDKIGDVRGATFDYNRLIQIHGTPRSDGTHYLTATVKANEPDPNEANNTVVSEGTVYRVKSRKRVRML